MKRSSRRALSMAVVVLTAAGCFAMPPDPARAHAGLESSVPAAGSSVPRPPAQISLTFAEDPDPTLSAVRLFDASGAEVPGVSKPRVAPGDPARLEVKPPSLADGGYTVAWRAVSAVDGHVENGTFAFGVGVPAPVSVKVIASVDTSPWMSALAASGRWLLYAGLAVFVGAASTCLLVLAGRLPAGGVTLLRLALLLAVLGFCATVWAERALSGAPSLLPLFQTHYGQLLLALGVAIIFCAATVAAVDLWPARWSLAVLGATGVAAMLAHVVAGHADAQSSLRLVNVAVQWTHMVAVGVWVGGLAWLLLGIRGMTRADRAVAVNAFSRVATVTLAVVLVTGAARGIVEVGGLANLFGTRYGVTLLVKLILVALLVALGAVNHFRLVPAIGRDEGATRTFRLNARSELAVAAAVLAATAVLSGLAPASAGAKHGDAPTAAAVSAAGTASDARTH